MVTGKTIRCIAVLPGLLGLLGFHAVAQAQLDGEKLYEKHCETCHRGHGEGSIGLPLNPAKFKSLTDEYLFRTIRNGRPGRIMPAFETLSDAQVNAIVGWLRTWSQSEPLVDSGQKVSGNAENGEQLFLKSCVVCHGKQGKGLEEGTGVTYSRERQFKVMPPAIGNPGFLASVSDGMLKEVITHGREGTAMAAFSELGFGSQDVDDVIVYLRSLQLTEKPAWRHDAMETPDPTLFVNSPYDFDMTVANLKRALSGYNFRTFPDRYIEQGLFPEDEINRKQLTIRFCNFNNLYDMLKIEPRLGIGLPCRITVIERDDGQVQLVTMNMTMIGQLFNNEQLMKYAHQMQENVIEIMEEATL